jgi:hypothetical protein
LNFYEYFQFYKERKQIPLEQLDLKILLGTGIYVESNRRIMNILSGFAFYRDNLKYFASKNCTKEEQELIEGIKKEIYDDFFAYRLLEKLRNFSLHTGFVILPPSFLKDKAMSSNKETGTIEYHVSVGNLLNHKSYLSKALIKDLEEYKEEIINISPLIFDLEFLIDKIQIFFFQLKSEAIINAVRNLDKYFGTHEKQKDNVVIMVEYAGSNNQFATYTIPLDAMFDIQKFANDIK